MPGGLPFKDLPQNKELQNAVLALATDPTHTGTVMVQPSGMIEAQKRGPTPVKEAFYPTTTAGKLDRFYTEIGGEPIVRGGGARSGQGFNAYETLAQQLKLLQNNFSEREATLRSYKLSPEEHNSYVSKLQMAYDDGKLKIGQMKSIIDGINASMEQGIIAPEAGQQAMMALFYPQDVMAEAFPTVKQPAAINREPITPQQLSGQYRPLMKDFAEAAPRPGHFWTSKANEPRTQEDLIDQYVAFRENVGYDSMTPVEQRQIDSEWDGFIKTKKAYKWDPSAPDIKALRTYGNKLSSAIASKVSPFAAAIQQKNKSSAKVLDERTARALLAEARGDKNAARQLALQRGYKF